MSSHQYTDYNSSQILHTGALRVTRFNLLRPVLRCVHHVVMCHAETATPVWVCASKITPVLLSSTFFHALPLPSLISRCRIGSVDLIIQQNRQRDLLVDPERNVAPSSPPASDGAERQPRQCVRVALKTKGFRGGGLTLFVCVRPRSRAEGSMWKAAAGLRGDERSAEEQMNCERRRFISQDR